MTYAPILLFVYNRPEHTRQVVSSLLRNQEAAESPLFIYADQSKTPDNDAAVQEVRRYIHSISGFKSKAIIERESNWGLARNIIDGVTTQVNEFGRVIVLEDDLIVAPYFLKFMNDALETYQDEQRVGHIQACDFTKDASLPDTFLIKWTGSWGWGTWKRAWKYFNPDGKELLAQLEKRKLTRYFDFNGNYPFTRMLRRQIAGQNNSWAIRWNASLFLADILSLNVGKSLIQNTGFDGSGTNWRPVRFYPVATTSSRQTYFSHRREQGSTKSLRKILSPHQLFLGKSHSPHQAHPEGRFWRLTQTRKKKMNYLCTKFRKQ